MTRRRRSRTVQEVALLFQAFGIDILARWKACKSSEEVISEFQKARTEAKSEYRRLAKALHPDHGGDEERFKEVSQVWEILKSIEMRLPPPAPVRKSSLSLADVVRAQKMARVRQIFREGDTLTAVFVGVSTTTSQSSTATDAGIRGRSADWIVVDKGDG